MTTNDDVMREIIEKDDDFVNNQDVIVEMADSSYASKILGGTIIHLVFIMRVYPNLI